eukprot:CAMPEP_0171252212 /NCGR_PEP_ID=MMETSP0790-20130122/51048_1 /TAXON_ID=2925 /ORGANISM="Alexandrium catenella, Strain OF101" /LENGTH=46 /DNA_ID= /DNA_START= /DNA_END= /DNA_ORIENTATION=
MRSQGWMPPSADASLRSTPSRRSSLRPAALRGGVGGPQSGRRRRGR